MIRNIARTSALILAMAGSGSADTLRLYIDGDFTVAPSGAEAIELGVRTALAEHANQIGDFTIDVVPVDNRLNARRSQRLFERFAADPEGLAVVGGVYSPPYLTLRDSINARGLLTVLPWSAAGPITRAGAGSENYIFRLSVDDWKAGPYLLRHAFERRNCRNVGLLTTDTGWGRSNRQTINQVLSDRDLMPTVDIAFEDDLGAAHAQEIALEISAAGPDCLILVAGMPAGGLLLSELASQARPPRVISHWGIMSGALTSILDVNQRQALGLHILQTCGLQAEVDRPDRFASTLSRVSIDDLSVSNLVEIPASTGFVHAYDLTLLLVAATHQAMQRTDFAKLDARERQAAVKNALEVLNEPVDGLLQVYETPFGTSGEDAHEALGYEDLCTVQFEGDSLVPAAP